MTKKIILRSIVFFVLISTTVFAGTAPIENGGKLKYKAVRLTPEIYNNARENLADILIIDGKNQPVPYFINSYVEDSSKTEKGYDMTRINTFSKEEFSYFDFAIKEKQSSDILATSIEVKTKSKNFAKRTEVYGSYDNIKWDKVEDGTLYNVDGKSMLSISFNEPQKYTSYRIKVFDSLKDIAFDSAILHYDESVIRKDYFKQVINSEFTTEEKNNRTLINIKGMKNLKISDIEINNDITYESTAYYANGKSKTIFNLLFNGIAYKDNVLPFDGNKSSDDILTIILDNKDDKPIKINSVMVTYLVDEVIFGGELLGIYKLTFGNNDITTAPVYDIANYKQIILKDGYDQLNLGEVKNENPKQIPKYNYKLILNIVIAFIVLLLGVLIFLRLRKK